MRAHGKAVLEETKQRLGAMRDRLRHLTCARCHEGIYACGKDGMPKHEMRSVQQKDDVHSAQRGIDAPDVKIPGYQGQTKDTPGQTYPGCHGQTTQATERDTPGQNKGADTIKNSPNGQIHEDVKKQGHQIHEHITKVLSADILRGFLSLKRSSISSRFSNSKNNPDSRLHEYMSRAHTSGTINRPTTHSNLESSESESKTVPCMQILGDRLVHWNESDLLRVRKNGVHITGERDRVGVGTLVGGRALVKQGAENVFSMLAMNKTVCGRRGVGLTCLSGRVNLGNLTSGYVDWLRMEFRCVYVCMCVCMYVH